MSYKTLTILIAMLLVGGVSAYSQTAGPLTERESVFSQNAISNMAAFGDTLWVGPLLVRNIGNSFDWHVAENADSVNNGRGRIFSIALARDTVVAGLGYNAEIAGSSVQTAQGFYLSVNGGSDWEFISPPLDREEETTIRYGGQDIGATAIIVPQQSPPFNVAFRGDMLFTAAWASGIRRSTDFGQSWERLLLPPTELNRLDPEETYDFFFDPRAPQPGSPNSDRYPNAWQNFLGFSGMIDSDGYVWAGTAGGVNVSDNALTAPADSIRWRRSGRTGSASSLLGNWVIRIRQNPYDGKVWLTNWISGSGDRQGLVSTTDRAVTFEQHLIGERINDITFNGPVIFAAGDTGLFISHDNGNTWVRQPRIQSANAFLKPDPQFRTAASGGGRVWIGSSDGLISTTDDGETWQITRVDFPLSGGNIFQPDAPSVRTYAYPNPFSVTQHGLVRIRYELPESATPADVRIRLFDFAMNPVRTLESAISGSAGIYETGWDGLDQNGLRIPNGPVFYQVTAGGTTINGKILMLD